MGKKKVGISHSHLSGGFFYLLAYSKKLNRKQKKKIGYNTFLTVLKGFVSTCNQLELLAKYLLLVDIQLQLLAYSWLEKRIIASSFEFYKILSIF